MKARIKGREFIQKYKESNPCTDCGNFYPYYVMDFDHQKDKKFLISKTTARSIRQIQEEINKCEVVCANCHRVRTFIKSGDNVPAPSGHGNA